jgi:hypothetical protein
VLGVNQVYHLLRCRSKVTGHSATFINDAFWESADHFEKVVGRVMDPQDRMSAYPPSKVASPLLFKKVAVQGTCVD